MKKKWLETRRSAAAINPVFRYECRCAGSIVVDEVWDFLHIFETAANACEGVAPARKVVAGMSIGLCALLCFAAVHAAQPYQYQSACGKCGPYPRHGRITQALANHHATQCRTDCIAQIECTDVD